MVVGDLSQGALVLATLCAGVVVKHLFSMVVARRGRRREYVRVGEVASLTCYPIKSCGGFNVEVGECTDTGLQVAGNVIDRHWVVTDAKFNVLSAGQMPRMSLVQTRMEGERLVVTAPDMSTLTLPIVQHVNPQHVVTCDMGSGKTLEGLDCGDEAAAWFSKFLSRDGVRLLHSAPGLKKRDVSLEKKSWGNPAIVGDKAAFSDFCAYLVMTESSQEAINETRQDKISLKNFRPSIVFKGTRPFEEDEWQSVKIGETAVLRTLYCTPRCIKVNVDHTIGERYKRGKEPLEDLRKSRCFPRYGRSPVLGISSALDIGGRICVGDPVYARIG